MSVCSPLTDRKHQLSAERNFPNKFKTENSCKCFSLCVWCILNIKWTLPFWDVWKNWKTKKDDRKLREHVSVLFYFIFQREHTYVYLQPYKIHIMLNIVLICFHTFNTCMSTMHFFLIHIHYFSYSKMGLDFVKLFYCHPLNLYIMTIVWPLTSFFILRSMKHISLISNF